MRYRDQYHSNVIASDREAISRGYYTSDLLNKSGIHHGFGTRKFTLASSPLPALSEVEGTGEDKGGGEEGWACPERSRRSEGVLIPLTRQIHTNKIHFLKDVDKDRTYIGDAYLTDKPNIICPIRTADCLPLLVYDKKNHVVGAIHAGWKSILSHIIRSAISKLFEIGSRSEDIIAVLGPHIRQTCYDVGKDLIEKFEKDGWPVKRLFKEDNGAIKFSLEEAVLTELENLEINKDNIEAIDLCSHCNPDRFYSYRRNPEDKGRQINFITLACH